MSNRTKLRVVFARNPPDAFANCPRFPQLDPIMQCPFPGWTMEVLKMIADSLKWDIVPVVLDTEIGDLNWGTLLNNNTWDGVLGYLENDIADSACLMYQMTDARDEYFQFSYPVTNVQPIFVVKAKVTTIGSVLWNAFNPFTYQVWLCFLANLILCYIVLLLISRVEVKMESRPKFRPFELMWQIIELQLGEKNEDFKFFTLSGNIVFFAFALLQCGLMVNLYEALLLTALIRTNGNNPFATADEMIQLIGKGQYHLTTNYMGNWYFDDLKNSDDAHFVSLRAAVANNPVKVADSVSAALDLVDTGKYIYPIQQDSLAMQMSKERCNYVYVSNGMPQVSSYFVFAQNFTNIKPFNHQIIMNQEFVQRTFNKYLMDGFKLGNIPKCSGSDTTTSSDQSEETKPFNLESVFGVFIIGLIGLGVSIVVFVAEIYYYWHLRILERRARMKDPWNIRHLASIAQIHFTTSENFNNIDVIKLMDKLKDNNCVKEDDDDSKI